MAQTTFSESIAAVLSRLETGITLEEADPKAGVHVNTIRLWKKKYGQLGRLSLGSPFMALSSGSPTKATDYAAAENV